MDKGGEGDGMEGGEVADLVLRMDHHQTQATGSLLIGSVKEAMMKGEERRMRKGVTGEEMTAGRGEAEGGGVVIHGVQEEEEETLEEEVGVR